MSQVIELPKSGNMSQFRFVARHWNEKASFFEKFGISTKSLYRLKQELKTNYPEVLARNNPLVAKLLLD